MGKLFARYISEYDEIEELWIIARRRAQLEELALQLDKPARVLAYDLTEQESIRNIKALLEQEMPEVAYLVNNAGFGKFSTFADLSLQETNDMISLNCRAAVDMTVISIPYMRHGSKILEIASASAFHPMPGMNIYASTKAFLLSYTRALRWELSCTGIKVTAVCPIWVKTDFMDVARDTKNGRTITFFPFTSKPDKIVRRALRLNRWGLAVATCSLPGFVHRVFSKFIPHCILIWAWNMTRRIR